MDDENLDKTTYENLLSTYARQYHNNEISHNEWMRKKTRLFIKKKMLDTKNELKRMHEFREKNVPDECSICCERVETCDQLECGHYTHLECLKQFQEAGHKLFYQCPVCKHEISNMRPDFNLENNNLRYHQQHINGSIEEVVYDDAAQTYWILPRKSHQDFVSKIFDKCYAISEEKAKKQE